RRSPVVAGRTGNPLCTPGGRCRRRAAVAILMASLTRSCEMQAPVTIRIAFCNRVLRVGTGRGSNSRRGAMLASLGRMSTPAPSVPPEPELRPRRGQRLKRLLLGGPKDLHDPHLFRHISLVAFLAWVGLGADGL